MENSNLKLYHDYKLVKEQLELSLKTMIRELKSCHTYIYRVNDNKVEYITSEMLTLCRHYYAQAMILYDFYKDNMRNGLYNHLEGFILSKLDNDIHVIYNDILKQYISLSDKVN